MKRVISLVIALTLILGSLVAVYANDLTKSDNDVLSKDDLQKKIEYLNDKYSNANLKIEDFLALDELFSKMSEVERFEFISNVTNLTPERVLVHEDDLGVESTLYMMAPGVVYECGRVLGDAYYGGTFVSYTGTVVYLENLFGSNVGNLAFDANHDIELLDYSGYVNWSGNVRTVDSSILAMGRPSMVVSRGSTVHAIAYYCETSIGPAGIYYPNIPVHLYFNAETCEANVSF